MAVKQPETTLNPAYSDTHATATDWAEAREALRRAEVFWLTTVRPDGRPHVTPLLAVWHGEALYFCTGRGERKELNLRDNSNVALTTGVNALHRGLDIVVEGRATRVTDTGLLQALAQEWEAKYGPEWHFTVTVTVTVTGTGTGTGTFTGPDDTEALVFEVTPTTAFGFAKGGPEGGAYGQTRWRF
ncbi:putative pyridoxamine 5'-phosphate oxidase family protein [Thermocatellispora tengchongensis]|uniref:Putative pyridoxamine 5'-phosphate oxidase family protein n=1 Tax=Thermocatellispora tengchongensis TaxID=1073253 RepID=A0A840PLN7_9ACTN|nr:pyridoxamine 5'-phosphate oxidase family protein [Thermocatellispora tengchongensis]MBB5140408.1 putative pyridoxamine 5'-phosphate oxidase family protein [Thermocatellispora tengchongensis]